MSRYVLGIDGGNTKTLAIALDDAGRVLGTARAGCGDIYGARSPEAALAEIAAASRGALAAAGIAAADVAAATFSLAGADWPEDFAFLRRELPVLIGLRGEVTVVNDALGALRAGAEDWTGIAVVCGTGGAVGARAADGRAFHLGFWPDGAGARQLGRDGLRAVYRADLGLAEPTRLTELALSRYGARDAMDLLHAFTRRGGRPEADEGLLAADVMDAADAGDEVALSLVHDQARVVGGQARVAAERVDLPLGGAALVLAGGLLSHPSPLLADAICAQLPGTVATRASAPPVCGAALLALDAIGAAGDAGALGAQLAVALSV